MIVVAVVAVAEVAIVFDVVSVDAVLASCCDVLAPVATL